MSNILTSFMTRQVAEGQMVSFTYSTLDENGNFLKRNTKESFLLENPEILEHVKAINEYIMANRLRGGK